MEVVDLARFCCSRMGYDFPDPNPEVKRQWAVFEAMINLMTPEGFANLMGKMWPEMINAMPFGMGGMMRAMGKIPGALNLMKPMFPVLFPILLPMMMPKVMPRMLAHRRRDDPHARLHGRADAADDAESNGLADAPYDRRCHPPGNPTHDQLPAGESLRIKH